MKMCYEFDFHSPFGAAVQQEIVRRIQNNSIEIDYCDAKELRWMGDSNGDFFWAMQIELDRQRSGREK